MHFVLIGLMIIFVLVASYYDLRWGIGILAAMIGIAVALVLVSGLDIFGDRSDMKPEMARIDFFAANKAYNGVWQIEARLKNNSEDKPISSFDLRVRALDCPTEDSAVDDCTTIADNKERIDIAVPENQARDIRFTTTARELQPRGKLNWQLDVARLISH